MTNRIIRERSLVLRSLVSLIATVGVALVASAQPPSTAPYIQQFPTTVIQSGGADPYAMAPPPMSSGWIPSMGMGMGAPLLSEVRDRAWWRAEYLVWWTDGMDLPPLVTSSPPGTPIGEAGRLGFPDTNVLFGNQSINRGSTGGVRTSSGYWFTQDRRFGITSELFRLRNQSDGYSAAGDGDPILARPYFNVVTGAEDARLISYPGVASGSIQIRSKNKLESLMFAGKFGLTPAPNWQFESCERPRSVYWTLGYRRLKLEDNLHFTNDVAAIGIPINSSSITEHFATKNKFDGVQLGFTYQTDFPRARLESRMRVALGNNKQTINVGGSNVITTGGIINPVIDSGFLAQATNSGNFTRDVFTMIPELGVTLGIRFTDRIHGTIGYTILYYPNVVRAGDQIDTDLNPTQFDGGALVGAPRPRLRFIDGDFYAHGLNLGAEVRF